MSMLAEAPVASNHDILSILPTIIRAHRSIESCRLLEVTIPPSAEGRPGASSELAAIVEEVRSSTLINDSFTETLLFLAAKHNLTESALKVSQFHQPLSAARREHVLSSREISRELLVELSANLPDETMLVLTSDVRTRQGVAHLKLMDFKISANPDNHRHAIATAGRLGRGVLLNSGSSYHFYGTGLVTESDLTEWLLRAQLLSRYVDTRWITHQLLEKRCALRLSVGGAARSVPRLIAEIGTPS